MGRTRNAQSVEGLGYTAVLTGSWGNEMLLINNVVQTQNMTPKQKKKKKIGAWRIIIACIKEDQEWGTVHDAYHLHTVIFSYHVTSHFNE